MVDVFEYNVSKLTVLRRWDIPLLYMNYTTTETWCTRVCVFATLIAPSGRHLRFFEGCSKLRVRVTVLMSPVASGPKASSMKTCRSCRAFNVRKGSDIRDRLALQLSPLPGFQTSSQSAGTTDRQRHIYMSEWLWGLLIYMNMSVIVCMIE